jgi:hypothetical protein
MFSVDERERVRSELLAHAEADPDITAAAITGSEASSSADKWSDIDLALGVRGGIAPALDRWTGLLYRDFDAVHHWDLPWGATVYRVYLLPDWLEVDIGFTPETEFGPRGPNWRTVFGETVEVPAAGAQSPDELAGLAWHHVLHACVCIERGKRWQAEWLIHGVREHVLALACLRLGHSTRFAKGADLLPEELTTPLEESLVRSLDEVELRRALASIAALLANELERTDHSLAKRLRPMLLDLTAPNRTS